MKQSLQLKLLAFVAGALLPLAFAPVGAWPLAIACPAILLALQNGQTESTSYRTRRFQHALWFGLGLFGVGTSWVYVSIHQFGGAGVFLAALLTGGFVLLIALLSALPWIMLPNAPCPLWALVAMWGVSEWFRSWALTGFPWLYLGYSQLNGDGFASPLAGLAPFGGVWLVTSALLISAATLYLLIKPHPHHHRERAYWIGACLLIWLSSVFLADVDQVEPQRSVRVALAQGNIPQENKWDPALAREHLQIYQQLTLDAVNLADWVIWPEAALPIALHRAEPLLNNMDEWLKSQHKALLMGVFEHSPTGGYFNSAKALGDASGLYRKYQLVPFGEYVPLEQWLRGAIDFFDLPMSSTKPGKAIQTPITLQGEKVGMAICYEIVYPALVRSRSQEANALITISNDAWFGHSWGPHQHLQIVLMRALENGRPIIRGTNNGISGLIDHRGAPTTLGPQFTRQLVVGNITTTQGTTLFTQFGGTPIWGLWLAAIALCWLQRTRFKK